MHPLPESTPAQELTDRPNGVEIVTDEEIAAVLALPTGLPVEKRRAIKDAAAFRTGLQASVERAGFDSPDQYLRAAAESCPTCAGDPASMRLHHELDAEERDAEATEIETARRDDRRARADFPILTWAEILADPPEPPAVIRPGVPEVGVTVVAGVPKAGKTIFACQTALESRRSTLLIVEEGTRAGLSFRLRTQAAALGIVDPPLALMHRRRIRLDDPQCVAGLRGVVENSGYEVVIVDPLNRTHQADENRPTEMTRVMDGMAEIAYGAECAVLAVHHLNKPSADRRGDPWDRFRGASSIRSGTDANLILDGSGDRLHLIGEFRDAEPLSEWIELDRETLTFRQSDPPEAPAKVDPVALRAFVEGRRQVVARQVVEEFKVSKTTAIAALRGLGCDEYPGTRGTLTFVLGTVQ